MTNRIFVRPALIAAAGAVLAFLLVGTSTANPTKTTLDYKQMDAATARRVAPDLRFQLSPDQAAEQPVTVDRAYGLALRAWGEGDELTLSTVGLGSFWGSTDVWIFVFEGAEHPKFGPPPEGREQVNDISSYVAETWIAVNAETGGVLGIGTM